MTHTKTSSLAFISLQTCFPNSRGVTAPLTPLLPTPMLVYVNYFYSLANTRVGNNLQCTVNILLCLV